MRKFHVSLFIAIICSVLPGGAFSQKSFFAPAGTNELSQVPGKRSIVPTKFEAVKLNNNEMKDFLWSLPAEQDIIYSRNSTPVLVLPMPDGTNARFNVWESSIQEPGLEAKFPEIKTFAGQGIDDPTASIRFSYEPYFGFRAQILSPSTGRIYIDPYVMRNTQYYISYFHRDNVMRRSFTCMTTSEPAENDLRGRVSNIMACRGTTLRTYRAAITCTGEYGQAVGGGVAGPVHAAIVNSMNRITGVFEVELSIRMVLVANNNLIEYLNPATDPFSPTGNVSSALLNTNQSNTNLVIGAANYDIGHVFTADDNGLAQLGAVCGTGKARGGSGSSVLTGDGYDIDFVAHEMGHQFGAEHTFASESCASSGGSYEPGSGTTIMAYAGICSPSHNIQPSSDPIFHGNSFDQINSFLSGLGGACGTVTNTGNTLPQITSMGTSGLTIPIATPFTLTGSATDADGDALTYNWEGWDRPDAEDLNHVWTAYADSVTGPLFRTRLSKTSPSRNFPDMKVVLANYPGLAAPAIMDNPATGVVGLRGEVLPRVAREMKFRLTVRDNRAGGGGVVVGGSNGCQIGTPFRVFTAGTTPFSVLIPNGGQSWPGGSTQTITWTVAGTNAAPFNVADVKITLSVDGGLTYPHVVTASTPNDGTEDLVIPAVGPVTTARIKVEAVGNIFFDISNNNFSITGSTTPSFDFASPAAVAVPCGSTSATISLGTTQISGFSTPVVLTASGNPGGTTVSFSPNPVAPGSSTQVSLNNMGSLTPGTYNVTVTGTAGTTVKTRVISFIVSPGGGPVITVQPSSQSPCLGGPVSFSVTATGATSYQWQVSTNGGVSFNPISGATNSTYNVAVTTAGMNNYQYNVVVTNQCGTVTSSNAILTLASTPSITAQPVSVSVCAGANAVFNVTSTTPANYQWYISTNNGATFTALAGATMNILNLPSVTGTMNGYQYHVVVSNTCGTVTSNNVTLTITNGVNITAQPANASGICVGQTATFSVTATGPGLTYQWQVSTDGGLSYNNIASATSATYTTPAATAGMNNNRYRVIVGTSCGSPVTSQAAILTVVAGAAITTEPSPVSVCPGADATFTVVATGATGYQWQVSTNGGTSFSSIAGATTATLTLPAVTAGMNNNLYQVLVSGCATPIASSSVTLTISPAPTVTTQPAAVSSCVGGAATFNVVAANATTYQWQVSTDGGVTFVDIAGETNATLSLVNLVAGMADNQYRVLINNACGGTAVISNAATLTISAGAAITTQPADASGCAGSNVSLTVVATGAGGYQWQVSTNGGTSFTDIAGETSATLTLNGITAGMNNNQYQVVVGNCGGAGLTSSPATLTIIGGADITTQPAAASVCPGSDATFNVAATGASAYQWQVSTNGGTTVTNIAGATSATLTVPAVTSAMNNNQYQVLVTGACGDVTSSSATLTVSSGALITTQPANVIACEGSDGTLTVVASGATAYQWQVSTDGGTTFTNISGATNASYTLSGVTSSMNNNQYNVVITGACGSTTSSNATLTVNASPAVTANGPAAAVCAGSSITLTGSGAVSYTWDNGVTDDVPFTIDATNTYTVTGTDVNNCEGTASITVTVNAAPVVTLSADDTQLTEGETATLTATSNPAAASYVWYRNGNVVAGATGATLTVLHTELGSYTVEATDANGCSATSAAVEIVAGTTAFAFITPNANNGTFKVHFRNEGFQAPTRILNIYDEKGRLMHQQVRTVNYAVTTDVIDVSVPMLSKGSYWVVLSESNGRRLKSGKLIIQ